MDPGPWLLPGSIEVLMMCQKGTRGNSSSPLLLLGRDGVSQVVVSPRPLTKHVDIEKLPRLEFLIFNAPAAASPACHDGRKRTKTKTEGIPLADLKDPPTTVPTVPGWPWCCTYSLFQSAESPRRWTPLGTETSCQKVCQNAQTCPPVRVVHYSTYQ